MLSLPKLAVISLVVIVKGHRSLQCSLLPVKKGDNPFKDSRNND
jgi:hypothetical protein